jgi:hypothetical protein
LLQIIEVRVRVIFMGGGGNVGGDSEDDVGVDQGWVEDLVEGRPEREQQQQRQRERRPSEGGMCERGTQRGRSLVTNRTAYSRASGFVND